MYHKLGGGGWLGQHAFSRDAFTWASPSPCYNDTFPLEDGSVLVPTANGGAQRPMLLQDAAGDVSHLYIAGATCDPSKHRKSPRALGPHAAVRRRSGLRPPAIAAALSAPLALVETDVPASHRLRASPSATTLAATCQDGPYTAVIPLASGGARAGAIVRAAFA